MTRLDIPQYRAEKQAQLSKVLKEYSKQNRTVTVTAYITPLNHQVKSKIELSPNVSLSDYDTLMKHLQSDLSHIKNRGLYKLLVKERKEGAA